jgi:hypothetical protein
VSLLDEIDAVGMIRRESSPAKPPVKSGDCVDCHSEPFTQAELAQAALRKAALTVKCGIRADCLKDGRCIGCPFASELPAPQVGLIIAARNEGRANRLARAPGAKPPFLEETVESFKAQNRFLKQTTAIDDGSDKPETVAGVNLLRNAEAVGCSGARHRGCLEGLDGCDTAAFIDPHMTSAPRSLDRLARYAQVHRAFAYAGNTGHYAVDLMNVNGLLKCKWITWQTQPKGWRRSTGMMGAGYVARVDQLTEMGGWIVLPVPVGADEECMAVLCAKHGIPIVADCDTQNWHEYRRGSADHRPEVAHQQATPFDVPGREFNLSIALFHRILFEDSTWNMFKISLQANGIGGTIIAQAEQPEIIAYGASLRERCKMGDAEFFFNLMPKGTP